MIRKTLLLGLALAALVALPVAAQETDYDGTSGSATVTDEAIVVSAEGFIPEAEVTYEVDYEASDAGDDEVGLVFSGYEGEIAFGPASVSAPLVIVETGTARADANGNVNFAVTNRGEGRYTINMTDGVNTAVVGVTVGTPGDGGGETAGGSADGGSLPRTGSDSPIGLVQVGAAAIAMGAVVVYGAKRRRAKAFAD